MASELPPGFELIPAPNAPGAPTGASMPSWLQNLGPEHQSEPAAAPAASSALPPGFELVETPNEKMGLAHGLAGAAADIPLLAPIAQQITGSLHALNPTEGYSQKPTFTERRQENVAKETKRQEEFGAEHPIASTAANIAGTIVAAAPAAATAVGATALGMGGRTVLGQAGRMAASGAGISGTDAALRGNDPTTAAIEGGLMGGAIGGIVPLAGKAIGGTMDRMAARNPMVQAETENAARQAITPAGVAAPSKVPAGALSEGGNLTTDAIESAATNSFRAIDQQGVKIAPTAINRIVADTGAEMHAAGLRPQYQKAEFGMLRGINGRSGNATFGDLMADLQEINKRRGEMPNQDKNYLALGIIKNNIQKFMNNLKPGDILAGNAQQAVTTLQEANKNWSAFRGTELLEKAMRNGLINAASSGTGTSNTTNNLIQAFKPIYKKILDGKLNYSPEVTEAIKQVSMGKTYGLRALSKFAPTGIVSLAADIMMGHGIGGAALGLMGVGKVAKSATERMTLNRIQKAIDLNKAQAPAQQRFGSLAPQLPSKRLPGFLIPANNP